MLAGHVRMRRFLRGGILPVAAFDNAALIFPIQIHFHSRFHRVPLYRPPHQSLACPGC
jgi:hypothetical protein